jgi:hypothetical protein
LLLQASRATGSAGVAEASADSGVAEVPQLDLSDRESDEEAYLQVVTRNCKSEENSRKKSKLIEASSQAKYLSPTTDFPMMKTQELTSSESIQFLKVQFHAASL